VIKIGAKTYPHLKVLLLQGEGCVGDEFMRQIEPIAAYLPYMTCPGNHEQKT
jgi:hypothetical protein